MEIDSLVKLSSLASHSKVINSDDSYSSPLDQRVVYKVRITRRFNKDIAKPFTIIGLISLLTIQMFIHIGVNSRLFPTTGMTLPFLSYGGSSLIGSSIIAGIILNFTRKDSTRDFENE